MIYHTVKTRERAFKLIEDYATLIGCTIYTFEDSGVCSCECGQACVISADIVLDNAINDDLAIRVECAICKSCGDDDLSMNDVLRTFCHKVQK